MTLALLPARHSRIRCGGVNSWMIAQYRKPAYVRTRWSAPRLPFSADVNCSAYRRWSTTIHFCSLYQLPLSPFLELPRQQLLLGCYTIISYRRAVP